MPLGSLHAGETPGRPQKEDIMSDSMIVNKSMLDGAMSPFEEEEEINHHGPGPFQVPYWLVLALPELEAQN